MEIVKRLALVIHWIGFTIGVISCVFAGTLAGGITVVVWELQFSLAAGSVILFGLVGFLSLGLGWLIRWIIVGKIHWLPWK